jgi:hypothetical protein
MALTGIPIFDLLKIMLIHIDLAKHKMVVEAAFKNSKTGNTHAWCREEGDVWSPETKAKIVELELLLEADLAKFHFGSSSSPEKQGLEPPTSGIGEHLGEDAPSV